MSGGSHEYVMGNIVSSDGTAMISGNSASINSGYTGTIYNSNNYTSYIGTYNYPDNKYYDKYSFGTSNIQRNKSKLGDATKEVYNSSTYGWYNDYSYLARSNYPWFLHGGIHNNGTYAGMFNSGDGDGSAYNHDSVRLTITQ